MAGQPNTRVKSVEEMLEAMTEERDYFQREYDRAGNICIELRKQDMYQLIATLGVKLSKDGNQWCYLLGSNLQEGIAGFGDTAYQAAEAFYQAYHNEKIPSKKVIK